MELRRLVSLFIFVTAVTVIRSEEEFVNMNEMNTCRADSVFLAKVLSPSIPQPESLAENANANSNAILRAHNKYRTPLRIAPLRWSTNLEKTARRWANVIARESKLRHSGGVFPNTGENLWKGWGRRFSYTEMVDAWGKEKRYFRYGTFPHVSTTGNWFQVGHYTQMIWRGTRSVGCAGAGSPQKGYVFVCHYRKPGNVMNRRPY